MDTGHRNSRPERSLSKNPGDWDHSSQNGVLFHCVSFYVKVMTHAAYDEDKWKAECGCFEPPLPPKKASRPSGPREGDDHDGEDEV